MDIEDLEGRVCVHDEQELVRRLRSVRKGKYGAFILSHDAQGPALWVHIDGSIAYVAALYRLVRAMNERLEARTSAPVGLTSILNRCRFAQTSGTQRRSARCEPPAVDSSG